MKHIFFSLFLAFILSLPYSSKLSAQSDSLSLYLFLLDDCPICLDYTITIKNLHKEYGDQISFVGYFPNFSSKPHKIDAFKQKYGVEFPLETDYYKTQAKRWGAEVTPEAILYNHTTEKILYQGRIDNKFVKLGKRRNVVTKFELTDAIVKTLEGKDVEVPSTEPIGCFINYSDQISDKK